MEVVYPKEKKLFYFLFSLPDKFLAPLVLTPLEIYPGAASVCGTTHG